jgi:flavorubredoxin
MKEKRMTNEELHFLGIKVVYKDLVDKGYKVLNVRKEIDVNPQILAEINDVKALIMVRTARFPNMGVLVPEIASQVKELAKKHRAHLFFASVGIANANGDTDEEMSQPLLGGEYYINYKGLTQIEVY